MSLWKQRLVPAFLFTVFFILTSLFAPGQAAPAKPAAANAASANFSDQAYVIEKVVRQFRRENDGTGTNHIFVRAKVMSEAGVQALGLLSLPYDNYSESL